MKKFTSWLLVGAVLAIGATSSARAHNVWLHPPQLSAEETITAFYSAGEIFEAQKQLMAQWLDASSTIELGVMAEFESKVSGKKIQPQHFEDTYSKLQVVNTKLADLRGKLVALKNILEKGRTEPNFDAQLTKILANARHLSVVSLKNRYGDVAGESEDRAPIVGIKGVIDALISDVDILSSLLAEVLEASRDALPLAQKGEFAKVMLSGRNRFGDKMPQFTDLISAYDRFYNQMVLSTITSTMQVYPKGFEFLK